MNLEEVRWVVCGSQLLDDYIVFLEMGMLVINNRPVRSVRESSTFKTIE